MPKVPSISQSQSGDLSVTEIDAFTYIDLRLDSITPPEGAIAGGTRVEIQGNGFGPDSRLFFDQREATDVVVVNDQTIVARNTRSGFRGTRRCSHRNLGHRA